MCVKHSGAWSCSFHAAPSIAKGRAGMPASCLMLQGYQHSWRVLSFMCSTAGGAIFRQRSRKSLLAEAACLPAGHARHMECSMHVSQGQRAPQRSVPKHTATAGVCLAHACIHHPAPRPGAVHAAHTHSHGHTAWHAHAMTRFKHGHACTFTCRLLRETFEPEMLTSDSRFSAGANTAVIEVRGLEHMRGWSSLGCGACAQWFTWLWWRSTRHRARTLEWWGCRGWRGCRHPWCLCQGLGVWDG